MFIDYSKIYSVVSANEEKSQKSLEKILLEFENLNKQRGSKAIREYLKENYNLKEAQTLFFLDNKVPVKIIELEKNLVLELEYQNEHRSISFYKEVK